MFWNKKIEKLQDEVTRLRIDELKREEMRNATLEFRITISFKDGGECVHITRYKDSKVVGKDWFGDRLRWRGSDGDGYINDYSVRTNRNEYIKYSGDTIKSVKVTKIKD